MLTITQLKALIQLNEQLLMQVLQAIQACKEQGKDAGPLYDSLMRLQNHRAVLKDSLIEALEAA